jgi:hypothetical protein
MVRGSFAARALAHEARSLLTRLSRVKPLVLVESMLPAASISPLAQIAIEDYLVRGRQELRALVLSFLSWLQGDGAESAEHAQRRYAFLRLKFNTVLSQFDLFADALTQRSERETGVWLAGLDVVALDALRLPVAGFRTPAVVCYLDRGVGAAIRRARTRLPGGGHNPVAIIRVPRERMVGSGIASSLVHEVGHQGAALLGLVDSLRPVLRARQTGERRIAFTLWERWISEILSDFWSVARVGVASTVGLMGVVSIPRPFVLRLNLDDPHPIPWIRVMLSCAMGRALYPHPQWRKLAALWSDLYPLRGLDEQRRRLFEDLQASIPEFVALLVSHRPPSLRGKRLVEAMAVERRQPARLAAQYRTWQRSPSLARRAPPTYALAVIGQAKVDGLLSPEHESRWVADLLTHWALLNTLAVSAACARRVMTRSAETD